MYMQLTININTPSYFVSNNCNFTCFFTVHGDFTTIGSVWDNRRTFRWLYLYNLTISIFFYQYCRAAWWRSQSRHKYVGLLVHHISVITACMKLQWRFLHLAGVCNTVCSNVLCNKLCYMKEYKYGSGWSVCDCISTIRWLYCVCPRV